MLGAARCALRRLVTAAEVVPDAAKSEVVETVKSKIDDARARLFAVVYLGRRQFKVSENDLISIKGNQPLSAGDKINLEKILLVGSRDWTVMGRPLLMHGVQVKATVVESTHTQPELIYIRNNHKQVKVHRWTSDVLTVLRINEITVDRSLVGPVE